MRQIIQHIDSGATELVEAPAPALKAGHLLVDTTATLVSAGTERMLVDFGRAGLLSKIRSQPEKVRQVIEKIATDGLLTTVDAVRAKLGQPIPLGYCNVGVVRESLVTGIQPGVRIASNGPHADVVAVGQNLCARVPDNVSDDAAAFTVLASIGLQGIRLAQPLLGETFAVTGVGLIGLLTVQLLRAQGCRVLAIDFDENKLSFAQRFGAEICNLSKGEDPVAAGFALSRGAGVDGVIVTASTQSSEPISQAARMCRKRGRIVLVGVSGLELKRADFYEKELSFQVSCSYGPGRYDPAYEEEGRDYPFGYVRWTEQRNFVAVLDLMARGVLDVECLITHRIPFEEAPRAYDLLTQDKSALGILLKYSGSTQDRHIRTFGALQANPAIPVSGNVVAGFIGAGNYASRMLIPAFRKGGATLHGICSSGGLSAAIQGGRSGFRLVTSDVGDLLADSAVNTVAITTRHDSHASLVQKALRAGKHVYVEKPLALTLEDVASIEAACQASGKHLMVGFNRRFAPHVLTMKRLLSAVKAPKSFVMVMNAGAIAKDHWTQNAEIGGGRIIGEACHHIDLMRHLAGARITSVQARRMGENDSEFVTEDKAVITLGFADGSFGTVHYLANGAASFPKERIEVFAGGRTLQLNNFMTLKAFNWPGFKGQKLWRQDKGHYACARAFIQSVERGGPSPIPSAEIFEVSRVTIEVARMMRAQK